jgi:hypothetical protein
LCEANRSLAELWGAETWGTRLNPGLDLREADLILVALCRAETWRTRPTAGRDLRDLTLIGLCGFVFHRQGRPSAGGRLFQFSGGIADLNQPKSTGKEFSHAQHIAVLVLLEKSSTHARLGVGDVAKKLCRDNQRGRPRGRRGWLRIGGDGRLKRGARTRRERSAGAENVAVSGVVFKLFQVLDQIQT